MNIYVVSLTSAWFANAQGPCVKINYDAIMVSPKIDINRIAIFCRNHDSNHL